MPINGLPSRRRRKWTRSEKKILVSNYAKSTIYELLELLPGRDQDSINSQIRRLKINGDLTDKKKKSAVKRAYKQRDQKAV